MSQYVPDPYKVELLKFFATPAWQALKSAALARRPEAPQSSDAAHSQLHRYTIRDGYDIALAVLEKIPQESQQPPEVSEHDKALLNPRD